MEHMSDPNSYLLETDISLDKEKPWLCGSNTAFGSNDILGWPANGSCTMNNWLSQWNCQSFKSFFRLVQNMYLQPGDKNLWSIFRIPHTM